jgi:hypothetical protein
METLDFEWPDGDFASNYGALEFPASNGTL